MTDDIHSRAHVTINIDDLVEMLGLPGEGLRMWVEDDPLYLHVILEGDDPTMEIRFFHVGNKNWIEQTSLPIRRPVTS